MDVGLVRKGVVIVAEPDEANVENVDEDASGAGEEPCEAVSTFVVDAADAEVVGEAVCADCPVVDWQTVHWYDDEGQPGSARFEMPKLQTKR